MIPQGVTRIEDWAFSHCTHLVSITISQSVEQIAPLAFLDCPQLKKVEIEDARYASQVTEMLMGNEVPPRKAFIYEHANDAQLDI